MAPCHHAWFMKWSQMKSLVEAREMVGKQLIQKIKAVGNSWKLTWAIGSIVVPYENRYWTASRMEKMDKWFFAMAHLIEVMLFKLLFFNPTWGMVQFDDGWFNYQVDLQLYFAKHVCLQSSEKNSRNLWWWYLASTPHPGTVAFFNVSP